MHSKITTHESDDYSLLDLHELVLVEIGPVVDGIVASAGLPRTPWPNAASERVRVWGVTETATLPKLRRVLPNAIDCL